MYAIVNPNNDLYWSKSEGRFVSERSGQYTTYATEARALQSLLRTRALRHHRAWARVVPDPAQERWLKLEELGHVSSGRL